MLVLNSQAVDHSPPISPIILLLPLSQPLHQLEDGALGWRRVSLGWPANEVKVLHHTVTILRLRHRWNYSGLYKNSVIINCSYYNSKVKDAV